MMIIHLESSQYPFNKINGDNAEFNLRVDHGLHELVRDWLLGSTAPVSLMNVDCIELAL